MRKLVVQLFCICKPILTIHMTNCMISSMQLLSTLLSKLFCSQFKTILPHVSALVRRCATLSNSWQSHAHQAEILNDDLLVQTSHKDIITVRSRFLSVSLFPSSGRFTAASYTTPRKQRAASLCLHHRQEGRRKLNEVSSEKDVNEKVLFLMMRLRHTTIKMETTADDVCYCFGVFLNCVKKKILIISIICLSYINSKNSKI